MDNVTLPGTSQIIATDDVGGVQYQVIKHAVGGDGVATPVDVNNPLWVGGIRRDADTAYIADLGAHPLLFNATGRLKVSAAPADTAPVLGNITTNGGTVAMDCTRTSNLAISMVATSLVGHNIAFESSNDSTNGVNGTWYSVQVVRSNANTVETSSGVLTATPVYMWQLNASDYRWVRVRATAHTSGTAAYVLQPSAFATEPIPAVQISGTQPVSGTVTANIGTGSLAAGTNTIGGFFERPTTTGGLLTAKVNTAASTNATLVKASAGQFYAAQFVNNGAGWAYVKLFNLATAPTVGTSVPVHVIGIPPGGAREVQRPQGVAMSTGISYSVTGVGTDLDATAVAANQVIGSIEYF